MNEYISAERSNRYKAAHIKKSTQQGLYSVIASYRNKGKLHHHDRCEIWLTWILPNKRRDLDNAGFAIKFILDSLVDAKILDDDNLTHVIGIHHSYEIQDKQFGVLVTLEEK